MLAHGAGQEEILVRLLRHRAGEAFGRKSDRCVDAGRIRPLLALVATRILWAKCRFPDGKGSEESRVRSTWHTSQHGDTQQHHVDPHHLDLSRHTDPRRSTQARHSNPKDELQIHLRL
jgi:hypothetical protein